MIWALSSVAMAIYRGRIFKLAAFSLGDPKTYEYVLTSILSYSATDLLEVDGAIMVNVSDDGGSVVDYDSGLVERPSDNGDIFNAIAQAIRSDGYVVLADALPSGVLLALTHHLESIGEHEFASARVGRGHDQKRDSLVRSDKIAWINSDSGLSAAWLEWIAALQAYLNQHLFLGLFTFESHFASYAPGDFYQTHVDSFRGASNRMLSLIVYLNRDWQPLQGGELVIYHPENGGELTRVSPEMGKLVVFLSEEFPHEVKPALRVRFSVAGWFRVNASASDRVDPPE